MQTGKMINKISNRLRRRSQLVQQKTGLSGAKGNVLDYILAESAARPVYQKDIESEFGLRPPTATQLLKSLEKEGLIRRITDPEDSRKKRILFGEKAAKIETALRGEIEETEQLLLQGISENERKEFLRIAEKMLENLDD